MRRCEPRPKTPHIEKHFTSGEFVCNAVMGTSDGLHRSFRACGRPFWRRAQYAVYRGWRTGGNRGWLDRYGIRRLSCHPQRRRALFALQVGLEEPEPKRAVTSAATIAVAYDAGSFIALSPFIILGTAGHALLLSAGVTLAALAIFGYIKGRFTVANPLSSASQTTVIAALAAGAAFVLAKMIAYPATKSILLDSAFAGATIEST
jgi:VIT family protein